MQARKQRIHEAGREGLRNRLIAEWRLGADRAHGLIEEWEAEAQHRGIAPGDFHYWRDAPRWLRDRLDGNSGR